MIIGITGTDGAGKGAVVEYLKEKKGFVHYSSRALLEQEFVKRGIESNRINMRLVANELRAEHGNDFLVASYLQIIANEGTENAIIESIRAADEVHTLKQNGGILLAVDAKQSIRYSRIKGRKSSSDKVSLKAFAAHEALEMNDPDPHGMQKAKVIAMADFTIINNTSFKEMGDQIETFLQNIHD
jgi:dephospho-CoA kinase